MNTPNRGMNDHIGQLLAQARRDVEEAYAAAEAAWGSMELGKARPQALQLEDRIAVGKALLQEPDHDPIVPKALRTLRAALRRAKADPADRRRCRVYQEAYERFLVAEETYLGRVREARDIYGLSEEDIAEALQETAA
ncbi:MAG: hypothetical protein GX657_13660 [Chloroflexi bacterium]|nr:hypothetical protein [Chloroflexota bacterium]